MALTQAASIHALKAEARPAKKGEVIHHNAGPAVATVGLASPPKKEEPKPAAPAPAPKEVTKVVREKCSKSNVKVIINTNTLNHGMKDCDSGSESDSENSESSSSSSKTTAHSGIDSK